MGTLEISLFGSFQLERDGEALTRAVGKRARDLLGYLLLQRNSAHSREHLAGIFWGELDDRRARHCFNTALWRVHRVLGNAGSRANPYLNVDSQTVGFNIASDFRLDVAEFETRISWADQLDPHPNDQRVVLLRQAVSLYRGDLLSDCFEDWALVERERFRAIHLRALSQVFAHHLDQDDHEPAVVYGQQILASDPLREEVHRDLISLHLRRNQPADALRQYRRCEEVLERELGIAPMPETQALLHQMIGAGGPVRLTFAPAISSHPNVISSSNDELEQAMSLLREARVGFDRAASQYEQAAALLDAVIARMPDSSESDSYRRLRSATVPILQ